MEKRLHFTFFDKSVFIKSVIIVCFLSFFSAKAFSQATVSTDQSDYPPGSTVYITGSGFTANETVTLQVLHVGGGDDLTSPAHQPWTVTADASGNISSTWYVPTDEDEVGATLQLTATGQTSGLVAQTTFTDANTKVAVTDVTGAYGGTVNLTATLTQSGGTGSGNPIPSRLITFKFGSTIVGTATTNSSGVASLTGIYLTNDGTSTGTRIAAGSQNNFISAVWAGDASFSTNTGTGNLTVSKLAITWSITASDKFYDGSTTATILTRSATGALPPDIVTVTGGTATFADKNVASNKTVTATGAGLSGTNSGNYTLTNASATTTASIKPKSLTATASGGNKTYDGTTATNVTLTGDKLPGDKVTLTGTANFADKNVGQNKTVNVTNITLSNLDDGINYVLVNTTATTTANISPRALTITASNANKYFGTTLSTVTGSTDFTSSGLQNGETIGSVTITYNAGSAATDPVGTYTGSIVPSAPVAAPLSAFLVSNYNITYNAGILTVLAPLLPAPVITYNTPNTFVYGTAITTLTPTNTGGAAASYSIDKTLPSGLSFDTGTGAISGTPTTISAATNYTITAHNTTGDGPFTLSIEIDKASLTITAKGQSKVYGSAQNLGTSAFTTSALYNGDSISGVTLASDGSVATATVGTYDITPSAATGSGLSNYSISYVNGKDTVKAAALTITAKNQSKIYGTSQTLGTIAFTPGTLYNGDSVTGVTLASDGSVATATVGTYDITPSAATGSGLSNYSISYVNGKDTVKAAALTITAKNQSKIYGTAQTLGTTAFTPGTLYNGDSVTGVTLASDGSVATATVGTYDITPSAATGSGLSNYSISYVNGKDTVKAAALTITAKNQSKIYGTAQTLGTIAFTPGTLYNGDSVTGVTLASDGSVATATVGTYDITPSAATGSGLSNYSISYVNGKDTVKAAALTITAKNQSKIYGTAQTLGTTAFAPGTLYNGDSVTGVTLASDGSVATATVGTYDITPSAATGSGLSNYSISYVNGKDTVKAAALTITAKNQSKIYGTAQTLGTTAFAPGTLYNGDSVTGVTLTSSGSPVSAIVGTYDIVPSAATGSGLSNYSISYVNGKDTVKAAALTITAKNQSKIYGTAQTLGTTAFTPGTLYNGDSVTGVTLTSSGSPVSATVGTYDITPSAATGSGLSNYSISYVNGKDTVKAAALTITAKNQSKIYGTAQTLGTTAFAPGTLYNGDSVTGVTLTSSGSPVSAIVGTYDIVPSAATGSGLSNYSISYVNGKDTVKAAALTITAKNQSKIYGTAQTLGTTAFAPGTLYNGDSVTGVTLTSSGSPVSAIVGTYDIVPSAATGSGLSNYSISYVNGKDTVKVAPLTITAKNQSKIYGTAQTLGTTAVTALTLYNSDSVTGVTLSSDGSAASAVVGVYDIVPSAATGSGLSNYSISYVNGKDTVSRAPLTITAKDTSKVYGATITFAGTEFTPSTLYNGDQVTSVTLTSAGTGALASVTNTPYNIIITPGSAQGTGLSNYNITYKNGNLTVTPYVDCGAFVYNGTTFTNTDIGQTYGTVNLSLVLTSSNGGDARTATVKFYNVASGSPTPIGTAAVSTSSTSSQAIYTLSTQVPLNGGLSVTNTISWDVSGNFSNKNCSDSTTDVTVSSRTSDFLTGGGYVVLNPTTSATKSFGKYAGAAGTKTNFGFNVKWNKSLTNIQGGGFTAIIRTPTITYQLKAVKVTTLGVTPANGPTPAMATFTSGNATLTSVDPVTGVITTYASNANLTIDIADVCEPGGGNNVSSDLIGITLKDGKTGQLLYSNNWDGTKTIKQPLSGGNLQIHNDANTPAPLCSSALNTVASLKNDMPRSTTSIAPSDLIKDPGINPLSVTVYPNPSPNSFNISMKGGSDEKVDVTVSDVLGHLMKRYRVAPGTSIALGDDFGVGIYVVQVRQGQTFKYYRIYKAPN